ncbi:MAG: flagellar hook-associated protein 3 [Spirochaetaceae bacterium]|jgi:flagellar hook-associated protein 3 FlgL|nr:flagellar hook-associated protein 3 [Spirochaetaceae bacterium]
MFRISTNMPSDAMQYYLRRHEGSLAKVQAQIAQQTKIAELRDDPLAASHAVRYESYLARLDRFEKNTLYAKDHLNQTDSYLRHTGDIMQRIREIAVRSANGVYTNEDMRYMGVEVNELLKEIVSVANALGPDGTQLFAGDKAWTEPFRAVEGTVEGGGERMIVRVEYRGAGSSRRTEIAEGVYADLDIAGGEAFWAEKMQIFSPVNATNYRATEEGAFFVDGEKITVTTGDTVQAIIAKINDSPAPVKAYLDPQSRGIALEGTNAHLIRLEDATGSKVLQDLGVIVGNSETGAPNWNPQAQVFGGSAFDMVIRFRDALFRGDPEYIGGQGIMGMDLALSNLESRLVDTGSRAERAIMAWQKTNEEIPMVTGALNREMGLDIASAATDLAMLDFAHKTTLQVTAKLIPTTLLDFLR